MRRHRYRHYGFTLEATEELPAAVPAGGDAPADIVVELLVPGRTAGSELCWQRPDPELAAWRAPTDQGSLLRLRYEGASQWLEFLIDERGTSVRVSRSDGLEPRDVAALLLGQVFSCVLVQRGLTCLHAAVVEVDNRAIALVGRSGAGKSTMALALVQHGGILVADDVAVLADDGHQIQAAAGAPRLRMRPDAARSLLGPGHALEPVWSQAGPRPDKGYWPVASTAAARERSRPLAAVYLLAPWSVDCPEPSLRPQASAQALAKLMAHRHMEQVLDTVAHRRDFELLSRLVETMPTRELARPAGLETTSSTAAALLSDVRCL